MKTFARPAFAAALVLLLAGCASASGTPWTPPPPPVETPASASQPPASVAPSVAASVAPSAAASAPAASVPPAETGVVTLEFSADGQLQRDGAQVTDIAVTPGETVTFTITNSSGKPHSFYIGPSQKLLLGQVDGLTGIPEWNDTEPKELTWVVPADVAGLKFASTVGSDYGLTKGTFSVAGPAASVPAGTPAPASAAPSASPIAQGSTEPVAGRVIELELNGSLQILSGGAQIKDIPVTPGETIVFKITNTAGFPHNFWIGPDMSLMSNQTTGLVGIPDWTDNAPKELTWVVPADPTAVKFGCTFPGHYMLMNGTFSVAS